MNTETRVAAREIQCIQISFYIALLLKQEQRNADFYF